MSTGWVYGVALLSSLCGALALWMAWERGADSGADPEPGPPSHVAGFRVLGSATQPPELVDWESSGWL